MIRLIGSRFRGLAGPFAVSVAGAAAGGLAGVAGMAVLLSWYGVGR